MVFKIVLLGSDIKYRYGVQRVMLYINFFIS